MAAVQLCKSVEQTENASEEGADAMEQAKREYMWTGADPVEKKLELMLTRLRTSLRVGSDRDILRRPLDILESEVLKVVQMWPSTFALPAAVLLRAAVLEHTQSDVQASTAAAQDGNHDTDEGEALLAPSSSSFSLCVCVCVYITYHLLLQCLWVLTLCWMHIVQKYCVVLKLCLVWGSGRLQQLALLKSVGKGCSTVNAWVIAQATDAHARRRVVYAILAAILITQSAQTMINKNGQIWFVASACVRLETIVCVRDIGFGL